MSLRTVAIGLVVSAVGLACAAAAYWALLNVPESNVPALMLSGLLALVTTLLTGCTIATVLGVASGHSVRTAVVRAVPALPRFLAGAIAFGVLWWATTVVDDLWAQHSGEIDAMFMRYGGTADTAWAHAGVGWLMWMVRWGVGLGLVVAATAGVPSLAFSAAPLGATIAALLVGRALWPLAYWRPAWLAADSSQLIFVSVKLAVLLAIGMLFATLVLHAFASASKAAMADRR